jgi:ABC-type transport system involved in cytochrome c biogenesis permease subunit
MATDAAVPPMTRLQRIVQADSREVGVLGSILLAHLRTMASLRLTVALLSMGIFLILAGTFALTCYDMWHVVHHYFRDWFVWVEFRIFAPQAFFPSVSPGPKGIPLPGGYLLDGFPFPGGWLIGLLMFLNLIAAHSMRFTVQARGLRLFGGLAVIALGCVVTALVILAGQNKEGIQTHTWVDYDVLWGLLKYGLLLLWLGSLALTAYSFTKLDKNRQIERWSLFAASLVLLGVVAYLFIAGGAARINDSSMRILWQLIQSTFAGLVLLAGCYLAFKKRAGIVLLHGGIGFLMFNELWVGTTHVEAQMILEDKGGRSERNVANWVQDIRELELSIVRRGGGADGKDAVIAIPQSELLASGDATRSGGRRSRWARVGRLFSAGQGGNAEYRRISDERLPFDVQVLEFYENSNTLRLRPGESNRLADRGQGTVWDVAKAELVTGVDQNAENQPAAYVRFFEKGNDKPLSTHLVSVQQTFLARWAPTELDQLEEVSVGGQTYEVYLGAKRINKPYQVSLIDVKRDNYVGTDTARNYSSDVHIRYVDAERGINVNSPFHIWMNNPLRFAGDTFYQSGHNNGNMFRRELTILSVVNNDGWMIPYVCCMLVLVAMVFQFGQTLVRFLARQASPAVQPSGLSKDAPTSQPVVARQKPPKRSQDARRPNERAGGNSPVMAELASPSWLLVLGKWLPVFVVVILGGWALSKARPVSTPATVMNIHEAGKLPVAYGGRVKPLDTLARNMLRVISGKEEWEDGEEKKQPAIAWLLDAMAYAEGNADQKVFKIESVEVLEILGLKRRKGYLYSLNEIQKAPGHAKFLTGAQEAAMIREENHRNLTLLQRKLLKTADNVRLFNRLRDGAFVLPENATGNMAGVLKSLEQLGDPRLAAQLENGALLAPGEEGDKPWMPLCVTSARAMLQQWARDYKVQSLEALVAALLEKLTNEEVDVQVAQQMRHVLESFVIQKSPQKKLSQEEIQSQILDEYRQMSPERRQEFEAKVRAGVEKNRAEIVAELRDQFGGSLTSAIINVLGKHGLTEEPNASAVALTALLRARQDGDAAAFNAAIEKHREALAASPPAEYTSARTNYESFFNRFAPFYHAAIICLAAFLLVALSWLGWTKPLSRSALALIVLGLAISTFAIISRIYISGRPPVTNLYAVSVFIGWAAMVAGIIIELVFGLGIGNVLASVMGFTTLLVGHFLANDGDTMSVVVAVLDTQFWLSTHVICITLGYATTFMAGALGVAYILLGVLSPALNAEVSRIFGRIIYGILCFALFFSFVGTILGGLWADDSWGRFWGWDPKENGAMIIVLWNAVILHARWGGMIKERGLAVLAIAGNIFTSWSMFAVNELGVGLHSYGFTEGVMFWLSWFWLSQLVLIIVGSLPKSWWWSFSQNAGERPA